jgi:hypothetical protein
MDLGLDCVLHGDVDDPLLMSLDLTRFIGRRRHGQARLGLNGQGGRIFDDGDVQFGAARAVGPVGRDEQLAESFGGAGWSLALRACICCLSTFNTVGGRHAG